MMRDLSARTLFVLGLTGFVGFGAVWLLVGPFVHFSGSPQTVMAEPATNDPFELGQYYFNHDNDPAGPYDLAKAKYYYRQVIEADRDGNQLVWYQLGRVYFIEGDFNAALYAFDRQIEYFGDHIPNVYYMLGLTYGFKARRMSNAESDWQRAEDSFLRYIEEDSESWAARVDLAWVYFAQGKYEAMRTLLEPVAAQENENPWVQNMYGLALLNTEASAEAYAHFSAARDAAALLTPRDWGRAYPGNDPANWSQGLSEFKEAIEKNLLLAAGE